MALFPLLLKKDMFNKNTIGCCVMLQLYVCILHGSIN